MATIQKVNGISESSIQKVNGIAKGSIEELNTNTFPTASFLLDTYTGATVAYSLRQLSSTATNCITVVNSSGVGAIIGFSNGYVDTTAIANHCGTGVGIITRWYNQAGTDADYDLLQSSTLAMPLVYDNGMNTINGKAAATFDGSTDRLVSVGSETINNNGDWYAVCVVRPHTHHNGSILNQDDPNTATRVRVAQYLRTHATSTATRSIIFNTAFAATAASSPTFTANTQIMHSGVSDYNGSTSATVQAFLNSTGGTVATRAGSPVSSAHQWAIGSNVHGGTPGAYFDGDVWEVILWAGTQSADQSAIETEIDTYYSIP